MAGESTAVAHSSNPLGASVVSGGSGLLGSIFSGLFGVRQQKKANKVNREINQMNNEFNAIEAAKARDWQSQESQISRDYETEMWEKNNEYNDPASQRARLEAAGFNPNALVGSTGTYQSAVSQVPGAPSSSAGPSASSSSPAHQIPVSFQADFSSVAGAINSYYQNKQLATDTTGKVIHNDIDSVLGKDAVLASIMSQLGGRSEWLLPEYSAGRNSKVKDFLGLDFNKMVLENEALDTTINMHMAQGALAYINAEAQGILNKYLDAQQQGDLLIKASQIYSNVMSGQLSYEKAKESIQQQVLIGLQASGQRISNRIAKQTAAALIGAISEEAYFHRNYYFALRKESSRLAKSQSDLSESEVRKIDELIKRLQKDNKWYWFDKLTGAGSSAADAYVKYKFTKKFTNSKTFNPHSKWDKGDFGYPDYYW